MFCFWKWFESWKHQLTNQSFHGIRRWNSEHELSNFWSYDIFGRNKGNSFILTINSKCSFSVLQNLQGIVLLHQWIALYHVSDTPKSNNVLKRFEISKDHIYNAWFTTCYQIYNATFPKTCFPKNDKYEDKNLSV